MSTCKKTLSIKRSSLKDVIDKEIMAEIILYNVHYRHAARNGTVTSLGRLYFLLHIRSLSTNVLLLPRPTIEWPRNVCRIKKIHNRSLKDAQECKHRVGLPDRKKTVA